uniref:small monomeric GTPase n=1 Tax=Monodon monoceros TaxID=40151 RepID=A0A8C6C0A2_MONMO
MLGRALAVRVSVIPAARLPTGPSPSGPAMAKQYDVLFQLLMIGDSGVGKTCLLRGFTDKEFHSSHISTIGVDFKMMTIEVDGIKVRIQIWDTQYYRRAQGIFLVCDISSQRSYQHIMKWVSDVDENAPEGVQKTLRGNKADEEQKRQVGSEQGQRLAEEYGMDFYEARACTSLHIKESFTRELEGLRTATNDELALAELEEDKGKPEGPENSSKTCWC